MARKNKSKRIDRVAQPGLCTQCPRALPRRGLTIEYTGLSLAILISGKGCRQDEGRSIKPCVLDCARSVPETWADHTPSIAEEEGSELRK
jgi:hypothetical protein